MIEINLPDTVTLTVDKTNYTVRTDQWGEEFILAQVEQGMLIRMQRAASGKDPETRAAKRAEIAEDYNQGIVSERKTADPMKKAEALLGKLTDEQITALLGKLGK